MRAPLVLLVTSLIPASAFAEAPRRVLTMRSAERAIDLAWQAELAADYKGARSALVELVRSSTTSEETAARERIEEWLRSVDTREAARAEHGVGAKYFAVAFSSLKNFGVKRSDDIWRLAMKDVPQLARVVESTKLITVRPERMTGQVDKNIAERLVSQTLAKYGMAGSQREERFEVRIDVDASQFDPLERGARATAQASLVIREKGSDGKYKLSGNVQKRKVEIRRTPEEAKSFAARRALDEAALGLVFHLRTRMLEDAASRDGA